MRDKTKLTIFVFAVLFVIGAVLGVLWLMLQVVGAGGAQLKTTIVSGCDETLWQHVYNPQRLLIHERCVTVTGVIVDATHGKRKDGVRHEADGDCHGWLKLDAGQEQYINAGNVSDEDSNLVFEIVCLYKVTQDDAKSSCVGYRNSVKLPAVGSHVKMTGSWVQDDNHARWEEIHPVTRIEVLHDAKN